MKQTDIVEYISLDSSVRAAKTEFMGQQCYIIVLFAPAAFAALVK